VTTPMPSTQGSDHGTADAGNADKGNTGRDPVCGMNVDPATAKHRAEHAGHDYFFCSAGCRDRFVAEPARS
jgi:Cu+-exporting ATPase